MPEGVDANLAADLLAADDGGNRRAAKQVLGKLADLLERQGIGLDEIGRVHRVNVWQGFHKDADGEAQVVDLAAIQLSPKWAEGPEWPPVQPGPTVRIHKPRTISRNVDMSHRVAVVLPDMQIGYYRGPVDELIATHDEQAIDVALAVVRHVQPDEVVLVGDNLDLPEFGKYRLTPAFRRTTQATIDRATLLCAQMRAAAPGARIRWLAGNHEERLPNFVLDNAEAAFGLRQGGRPDGWPVLSVPHLCRMDDAGVEYLPGYPASSLWLNERLRVIHGDLVAPGSTAHKYLDREKTSVIYGHVHRREWAERTREDHDGPRTILALSPGCLARTDGAVPSTKQGTDLDGRPLTRVENWQQGLAVVTFEDGDGEFWPEQVPIHAGRAMYRGRLFIAEEAAA